jgi:flagellar M-ring protein FliF
MAAIDVDRLKVHARRFADGFTTGQKAVTILGAVAVVLAAYWFTNWASAPEYAPLYTELDASDAGEVTAELDSQGVPYKLDDGGRTVLVPRKDVYKTRVDLSAQGLPGGAHEGYPLLDRGGITKDEFSKRVDYQRALQGELARTIEEIDGVAAARVTLTIPRDSVFVGSDDERATASVLVEPSGGVELGGETVQSIVHLVSSSVADMRPDDVTVADSLGNLLAAPGRNGRMMAGEQLEQRSAFEQNLAKSVEDLVAASLGPGHAAVTVQAELDFATTETKTTEFEQPDDIEVPRVEHTETESFTGPANGSAGPLGPDGTPLDSTAGPIDYDRTVTESENALNTIEQTRNEAPGTVERLSISVLLDAESVDAGEADDWEDAIAAAAGIDTTARDDVLNVALVPFDSTVADAAEAEVKAAAAEQSKSQLVDMVRSVVTLLIVGLVLFLAWRAIKKAEANRVPLRVALDLRELEAGDLVRDADTPRLPEPARALEPVPVGVEAEVTQMIAQQPDEVAQTLRSWLADRRG